ncbi:MAG: hypothetical protein FJ011_26445 [Chloroflexi bacterium]|nr:hypothetical protein [Chloroflexota bacterium]
MNPLARSAKLRQEADRVMGAIGLPTILAPHGPVAFIGSYFLDTMAYPDIDISIPPVTIAQLFSIGGQIAASELVAEVVFQRSKMPDLPGGLYLKPRVEYGDWGRPWKIDIWSLSETIIAERVADMQRFQAAMTEGLRQQIIRYKCAILTREGRTPTYSGYQIYRAFLDEGLSDFEEVTRYLIAHGIQVEASRESA